VTIDDMVALLLFLSSGSVPQGTRASLVGTSRRKTDAYRRESEAEISDRVQLVRSLLETLSAGSKKMIALEKAAEELNRRFGSQVDVAYVPGKTAFRDSLCEQLGLSATEAEGVCDSLEHAKLDPLRALACLRTPLDDRRSRPSHTTRSVE
jgi:hypothetical protein